nr:zinc finger, CCHC-type [Tanacetum cinerariifolium]
PSEGCWGEAALIACYLLNGVNKINMTILYELWTSRRTNLNYLRVCDCRAVVRLLDPKMKALGDRGPSEGCWGEAALIACYLLNGVNKINMTILYELWTSRRTNLNYLRVCDCRAVVRLLDPKMKALGDRGIDCIFIRYVEHSKAFRIYDIEPNEFVSINSIIESMDAIFGKNILSPIPRLSHMIPNTNGTEDDIGVSKVPNKVP